MPNESAQPFQDPTQRKSNDRELVEGVLGSQAAADMEALTGNTQEQGAEPEAAGLYISVDEQSVVGEAEKIEAEKRCEEYITWAATFGMDEDWVHNTFIFETDGRVRVDGNLNLSRRGLSELPPSLYKVSGDLNLILNQITSLKVPDSVTKLYLYGNQISTIESIPDSVIELDLEKNPIESLDFLVGKVLEDLDLSNIKAKTIPHGIQVERIVIDSSQSELIADVKAKGYYIYMIK